MADDRYVVMGLARARAPWFRALSSWATEAIVPLDFLKCLTAEDVTSRLDTDRRFSALFVDATSTHADRDLIERCQRAGCQVIVIGENDNAGRWASLGATALLRPDFDRAAVLATLEQYCESVCDVPDADHRSGPTLSIDAKHDGYVAPLIAVTGGGGCGVSTIAAALAQGWADDARLGGRVALVDFAPRADQAMLHHVGDVVPGLQELVDAHRHGQPRSDQVRNHLFSIVDRRYDLLLGLRRARDWTTLRPAATTAMIESVRRAYEVVIADIDCDVDGQDTTGSADIEDRNILSRSTVNSAALTVVVGQPGVWGLHRLVGVLHDLMNGPLDPSKALLVINEAPRRARDRAAITGAIADLLRGTAADGLPGPIFVPHRSIESILRDGGRLPSGLTKTLQSSVKASLDNSLRDLIATMPPSEPVAIRPGELGTTSDGDAS